MKKIIHVSNFNLLRLKGCFQVGFSMKISNGLIRNGYSVYNYPDRDLSRMFGFGHMNFWGKKKVNEHLIEFCKMVRPDVLFIGHADNIYASTISEIRDMFPKLRVVQWNCDWIVPGMAERNINALNDKKDVCDVTFVSTGDKELLKQFKTKCNKVCYLPNMVDGSVETGKSFEKETLPYDIMLAASTGKRQFCGKDEELENIIAEAEKKIPDIKWLLGGIGDNKTFNGADYIEAFTKASMGFNISRVNDVYLYSSDRMAHIMANGQLAFVDRRTGFNDLFDELEVAFYSEPEEFFDKVKFFKQNPLKRMKMAKKGYEKVHTQFNEQVLTKYMMDVLFQKKKVYLLPWQIIL